MPTQHAYGSTLHRLSKAEVSVWIDFLSRDMLRSGELARLAREDAVTGVTTNPTIFEKALASGDTYDADLRRLRAAGHEARAILVALAATDAKEACDVLRAAWEASARRDGYVSIEVDPNLAGDADGTVTEAQRLHDTIDRPNLLVKIPATRAGLPAVEEIIARGVSINVTLIFSLARYSEVAEAYIRGVERLLAAGGDPRRVASVASFFVSRVHTEADARLDELRADEKLKGTLAIANAKLAYRRYTEIFTGERWERLAAAGATSQRCLWASTSTKNPSYADVRYVEQLIGHETVNTMPADTFAAFRDHGRVQRTLDRGVDAAERTLERFATAGVDYDDLTEQLERDGVAKFVASFQQSVAAIAAAAERPLAA